MLKGQLERNSKKSLFKSQTELLTSHLMNASAFMSTS